jgi:hypothetical protein
MEAPTSSDRRLQSHSWAVWAIIVLIAAYGLGWLGWQVLIVRHRHIVLAELTAHGARLPDRDSRKRIPIVELVQVRPAEADSNISKVRWLLGDRPVRSIQLEHKITADDRAAIEAFPEASVSAWR